MVISNKLSESNIKKIIEIKKFNANALNANPCVHYKVKEEIFITNIYMNDL